MASLLPPLRSCLAQRKLCALCGCPPVIIWGCCSPVLSATPSPSSPVCSSLAWASSIRISSSWAGSTLEPQGSMQCTDTCGSPSWIWGCCSTEMSGRAGKSSAQRSEVKMTPQPAAGLLTPLPRSRSRRSPKGQSPAGGCLRTDSQGPAQLPPCLDSPFLCLKTK